MTKCSLIIALLVSFHFLAIQAVQDSEDSRTRIEQQNDTTKSKKVTAAASVHQHVAAEEETKASHTKDKSHLSIDFWHGLIASFSVIIVSELGDKTFFIAAILAMRHSRIAVFLGAAAALFLMTVLSVTLGWATQIIPRQLTYYISTALFAIFGLKMLKEGYQMSPNEGQEEYEEAQEEVRKREDQNIAAVTIGGFAGHALCTGFAVLGGRMIAQKISVRTVTITGGIVFLLFALSAFFIDPDESTSS